MLELLTYEPQGVTMYELDYIDVRYFSFDISSLFLFWCFPGSRRIQVPTRTVRIPSLYTR